VQHWRERSWRIAAAVVVAAGATHVYLARRVLDPAGYEPPLGSLGDSRGVLELLSPGTTPVAILVGVVGIVAGGIGLVPAVRRQQPAGRIAITHGVVLCIATIAVSRSYWSLTFAPSTAAFSGACLAGITRLSAPSAPSAPVAAG
jgi:hypothetical protein